MKAPPAQRKLTVDQVAEIRAAVELREQLRQRAKRLRNSELAKRYGVSVRSIDRISAGDGWAWL